MATKNDKLILIFKDNENADVQFSFAYADTEAEGATIKLLMQAMITNTSVFEKTLTAPVSATLRVTTDRNIDIS